MANLTSVARMAGVSITTVSRVLNPAPGYSVAPVTRQRVLAAADTLRYAPPGPARTLVRQRSRIVAAVVGDMLDSYFAETVRGINDVAAQEGYVVVVCSTDRQPANERRYMSALREHRADAILFVGGDFYDDASRREFEREVTLARRSGMVMAALGGDRPGLCSVDVDDRTAARELAEYLIGLGHRRIGFVGGTAPVSTARRRLDGFREAMHAAGLPAGLVAAGGYSFAGGLAAAAQLLASRPTAIMAANDEMAAGALAAAHAAGLHVPDDVSVAGYGDSARAQQSVPALTSVSIPRWGIGAAAMEMVLAAVGPAKKPIAHRVMPHEIVIRESTAPPSAQDLGSRPS